MAKWFSWTKAISVRSPTVTGTSRHSGGTNDCHCRRHSSGEDWAMTARSFRLPNIALSSASPLLR